MTKKKSTKNWLKKHTKDRYVKMSISSGFRSRAFHKLQEIDEKYKIVKSSNTIIDLGASPGSWSEYIIRNYKSKNLIAVDKIVMEPIQGVHFINGDINNSGDREEMKKIINKADLVLSDIAPNITGIEDVDQAHFFEIFESISSICSDFLKVKGILVMKFFNGSSYDLVKKRLNMLFNEINTYKPDSSRSRSNEVFFICIGYKD
tara:strand:- start:3679 stop:4290 length:612 start_codon:yes stop_codon:yes gene_type:complete